MKLSETELEDLLRRAPQPEVPSPLKERLYAEIQLNPSKPRPPIHSAWRRSWWVRWWPSLATGGLTVVCLVVLGVQQTEIRQLRRSIEQLQQQDDTATSPQNAIQTQKNPRIAPRTSGMNTRSEIERLQREAQELSQEVRELAPLQSENRRLSESPALQPTLDVQDFEEIQKARAKAQNIKCINNMKQLGLAVRIWATDHKGMFPPNIPSMTKEIANPMILTCPDDPGRQPMADWSGWSNANLSYGYLGGNDSEPSRVMFRCPIHGNVTLCDGSVHSTIRQNPPPLINRGGNLYLDQEKMQAMYREQEKTESQDNK